MRFINTLLNLIFPPRASQQLVAGSIPSDVLQLAQPRTIGATIYLLPYKEPLVTALISEAKFYNNQTAQQLLAEVLEAYLQAHWPDATIVPIPLSKSRQRERGYNQIVAILQKTNQVYHELLQRVRNTTPQTSLERADRLTNLTGAFAIVKNSSLPTTAIVLVDDVTTTGATFAAAQTELRQHCDTPITCVALAH